MDRLPRRGPGAARAGVIIGLLLVLGLNACGTIPSPNPPSESPTAGRSAPANTASPDSSITALTIVYDDGAGKRTTWRLTCNPPGGDHPDPAKACDTLAAQGAAALRPVPQGTTCGQQFGGPETAAITGLWMGEQLISALSKQNNCEISRWKSLVGLLPA